MRRKDIDDLEFWDYEGILQPYERGVPEWYEEEPIVADSYEDLVDVDIDELLNNPTPKFVGAGGDWVVTNPLAAMEHDPLPDRDFQLSKGPSQAAWSRVARDVREAEKPLKDWLSTWDYEDMDSYQDLVASVAPTNDGPIGSFFHDMFLAKDPYKNYVTEYNNHPEVVTREGKQLVESRVIPSDLLWMDLGWFENCRNEFLDYYTVVKNTLSRVPTVTFYGLPSLDVQSSWRKSSGVLGKIGEAARKKLLRLRAFFLWFDAHHIQMVDFDDPMSIADIVIFNPVIRDHDRAGFSLDSIMRRSHYHFGVCLDLTVTNAKSRGSGLVHHMVDDDTGFRETKWAGKDSTYYTAYHIGYQDLLVYRHASPLGFHAKPLAPYFPTYEIKSRRGDAHKVNLAAYAFKLVITNGKPVGFIGMTPLKAKRYGRAPVAVPWYDISAPIPSGESGRYSNLSPKFFDRYDVDHVVHWKMVSNGNAAHLSVRGPVSWDASLDVGENANLRGVVRAYGFSVYRYDMLVNPLIYASTFSTMPEDSTSLPALVFNLFKAFGGVLFDYVDHDFSFFDDPEEAQKPRWFLPTKTSRCLILTAVMPSDEKKEKDIVISAPLWTNASYHDVDADFLLPPLVGSGAWQDFIKGYQLVDFE